MLFKNWLNFFPNKLKFRLIFFILVDCLERLFYDKLIKKISSENLVEKVSRTEITDYNKDGKYKLIVIDCGIKNNIIRKLYKNKIQKASTEDWSKEYLDSIVSVKSVKNIDEAIKHINRYGTMHTDCIITQNKKNAKKFLNKVKSSIAMHNTSTQFADGGEFGFGGEVGISTSKLPPRGPVGLNQLVSYKYQISSNGKIRK